MKCIVCEKPTFMSFRLGDIEASFCPEHLPKNIKEIMIRVKIY